MIQDFETFLLNESKKKKSDSSHPYFKGLSRSTVSSKKRQMKKQAKMHDDDPNAYKPLPGDNVAKSKIKKSKHTEKYEEMYGS